MDQEIAQHFSGMETRLDKIDAELRLLNVKVDAYWTASDRVQRLAFGLIAAATISIIAFIAARAFGWIT